MINNTALLKARIKMFNAKKQSGSVEPSTEFQRHKPRNKQSSVAFRQYSAQARQILHDISELRDLVLTKRKEYILCSGSLATYSFTTVMSETDRRQFDNDSEIALRQCTKLVSFFETQIGSDRALRREDELLHLRMVSQLLAGYLRQVCALIEQLRSIYRKKSERMRKICRLANLVEKYEHSIDEAQRDQRSMSDALKRRQNSALHDKENHASSDKSLKRGNAERIGENIKLSTIDAATNRRALRLDEPKGNRVRVCDFTTSEPKICVKESREDGKIIDVSNGWSELDDSFLPFENEYSADDKSSNCHAAPVSDDTKEEEQSSGDGRLDLEVPDLTANKDFLIKATVDQLNLDFPENRRELEAKKPTSLSDPSVDANKARNFESAFAHDEATSDEYVSPTLEATAELSSTEHEQLMLENRKLFDKFAHSNEDIIHIGRQLSEIQHLQNTFAEKVTEQEHDIDQINTQTVYTLDNLETANQFIRNAIKNTASRRVIALFCLIVLTFTLLFLDWYNP